MSLHHMFLLQVGPSSDPGGVTMIDSTKVYTKTKEQFGWPEDTEDFPETAVAAPKPAQAAVNATNGTTSENDGTVSHIMPLTAMDR